MRGSRGAMLIVALLMTGLFLVIAMGFLSQRASQNRAARSAQQRVQAKTLAEAGLVDARTKLAKRVSFPPLADDSQTEFTYSESLPGVDGGYQVTVDTTYRSSPYFLLRLSSTGRVGTSADGGAEVTLHAELDISPRVRGTVAENPNLYKFLFVGEVK